MQNEFILAFKHISSGEKLYFYCTHFRAVGKDWVLYHENKSKGICKALVELEGTIAQEHVPTKENVYYPFEFNTALL